MHPYAGFDRGLLQGIARYAQLHGPWVFCLPGYYAGVPMPDSDSISGEIFGPIPTSGRVPRGAASFAAAGGHGIIGRIQTPAIARTLLGLGPAADRHRTDRRQLAHKQILERVSEIRSDSQQAGRAAADIFSIAALPPSASADTKAASGLTGGMEGFCERVRESKHSCNIYEPSKRINAMPWHREQPLVIDWLRSLAKPVGVMACNDIRGRQVIEACLQAGFRVPDDVAVVGVDEDRLLCELSNPPLSSVVLNLERAGYQAAELLDGLMAGRIQSRNASSSKPSGSSPAARPTSWRSKTGMWRPPRDSSATTSARPSRWATSSRNRTSRGAAWKSASKMLGRSIRQEIQQARLAWSKKLLVETNLSAGKIAELRASAV